MMKKCLENDVLAREVTAMMTMQSLVQAKSCGEHSVHAVDCT